MAPTVTSGWELHGTSPDDGSNALVWNDKLELPQPGPTEVVVKLRAWSLNYPDLAIANGTFPWKPTDDGILIPGSDGAGEVLAIGSSVMSFKPNDKVIVKPPGTLRYHGVFSEAGLVHMPSTLTYAQAATLPCSALTAWNALHGLTPLKAGDYVLAQGTGGVSLFAILFALAAGATVIATASSAAKAQKLKDLGAQRILNYREDPNWGETARKLTRRELGCQRVIEVGGPQTIKQSFNCVARGDEIDAIGFLTGQGRAEDGPTYLQPLLQACMVRGIEVGNRIQFEEMNRAIEGYGIEPVVDRRVFSLRELKEAYKYVWDQRHFGKVVLTDGIE